MTEPNVILIGASVRAVAMSALRAGLRPWCADLFADADLRRLSPVRRIPIHEYPRGFVQLLADAPAGPVLYTGGLENHPHVVQQLAQSRLFWGNGATVLRQVRDPRILSQRLHAHGIACPKVILTGRPPPSVRWLRKPLKSAAGLGIEFWSAKMGRHRQGKNCYLQEWLEGPSYSGVYLGENNRARLLGVTRQLVGEPWLHAGPFRYCGSIGPATPTQQALHVWKRIGEVLVAEFGLRGLFGVDAVQQHGVPYPVEVNPRYTAAVEMLENAMGVSALALHRKVFENAQGSLSSRSNVHQPEAHTSGRSSPSLALRAADEEGNVLGKAILFAPAASTFPGEGPWQETLAEPFDPWQMPAYADIPAARSRIDSGQPILTFCVTGSGERECATRLQARAVELTALLYPAL